MIDLQEYFLNSYREELEKVEGITPEELEEQLQAALPFIESARHTMRTNQVVGLGYVPAGHSLRLQDGTEVSLVTDPAGPDLPLNRSGSVGITGQGRIERGLPNSGVVPITGKQP